MITYTYIVRCPECEDEFFDFFDEAKDFAMGCLTKKPIITQTEVNRNDFGECTDHCDLGTVWSWEDMMRETDAEPATSVFNKDDLKLMADGKDPEFDNIDNSVDFEISEGLGDFDDFDIGPQSDELIPPEFDEDPIKPVEEAISKVQADYLSRRKPMTKEEFAERLEVEDEILIFTGDPRELGIRGRDYFAAKVDGKYEVSFWDETYEDEFTDSEVAETFDTIDELWAYMVNFMEDDDFNPEYNYLAEACAKKPIPEGMTIEQLVEEMEENEDTVECVLCQDLFDKSECRKELNLGWLCRRCADDLTARGEGPVFKEDNYWDFLDEDLEDTRTLTELVKDSISHLVNDLGKDPWAEDFTDDVIKDIETNYDSYVPEDMEHYNYWCSTVASEVSRQLNNQLDEDPKITTTEGLFTKKGYVIKAIHKNRPELPFYYCGKPEYDWESPFNFVIDKKKAKVYISIEEANRDVADLMANEDIMRDFSSIEAFSLSNIVEDVKEIHDLGNEYDGGYPAVEAEAEPGIEETTEVSGSHLTHCPECGKNTFDTETGICVECGFN